MDCYKGMTFCPAECGETTCFRNKSNINTEEVGNIPIAWYVNVPMWCDKYKPIEESDASTT